jgi:diacylglycerol kinase family enzyme
VEVPVLLNGAAGQGRAGSDAARVEDALRAAGLTPRIISCETGELGEAAQRVAREKPRVVVAGGGDGTINAVASAVVGSDTALGVLPLGTLNHFAKDLKIPLELPQASQTIAAGHTVNVDVGCVNGRVFLNNSSLGLYPQIVRARESQQRTLGRGKWPALARATWLVFRRSPVLRLRLCLDELETQYVASLVFIGNNRYVMEGFNLGTRERLDAGVLSLYATQRRGRWGLFRLAFRALVGRLEQAQDFDALTAQTIVIDTRHRRLPVATDGEVNVIETPLEYAIRPRALRVIVPAPAPAQAGT